MFDIKVKKCSSPFLYKYDIKYIEPKMLNTLTFKFDIPDSLLPEEDIVTLDWGYLTGDINNQTDLVNLIDKKVTDSSAVIDNKIKDISTDINNINSRVDTLNDRLTQKVNSTDFENYQLSVYTKTEVYTKAETDSQINAAKPDLEPYAKKTDIPDTSNFVTNTSVNANYSKIGHTHSQYLTESALDDYVKKDDIPEMPDMSVYVTNSSLESLHINISQDIDSKFSTLNETLNNSILPRFDELPYSYAAINHTHDQYITEDVMQDYVDNHVPEIDTTSLDSSISDISTRLNTLTSNFNTLVGNDEAVNGTINTFKEMESFLNGVTDSTTLTGLLENMNINISQDIDTKFSTLNETLNNGILPKFDELPYSYASINHNHDSSYQPKGNYVTNSSLESLHINISQDIDSKFSTLNETLNNSILPRFDELPYSYAAINHTHNQYALKEDVQELQLYKFPNATIFGTPTINNGQISNFSANNYLQFPFVVDFKNRPFEIMMCFTTGNDVTVQQNLFDSVFGLAFAVRNERFVIAYSTNGTTWDAEIQTLKYNPVKANTTYYARLKWDGQFIDFNFSYDKDNWLGAIGSPSTVTPYPTQIIIGKSIDNRYPFKGIINLNNCSLTISDKVVWTGMDDAGLATRLAVDMSNIDAAGEQKIKDIVGPIPEAQEPQDLTNYLDKTYTGTNVIKGKFQVGEYTDNITNAYLHIRNVGSNSITGYNVNGACFTVNGDGTASFQHKTYADNGTGAKNSAVLRFSNKGIQFAVNSGTGDSPSEDMYKELATQNYVDTQIGDIKTILESI